MKKNIIYRISTLICGLTDLLHTQCYSDIWEFGVSFTVKAAESVYTLPL